MRLVKSIQRTSFEKDVFPHLEVLWRTAIRLTERRNLAVKLVLKTITQAYRLWENTTDKNCTKKWLFRILTREFFEVRSHKHWLGQFKRENIATSVNDMWNYIPVPIGNKVLTVLPNLSYEHMKKAISQLKPQSRLILLLLVRENFTSEEIAFITDLQNNSIRSILRRCRQQIYLSLLSQTDEFETLVFVNKVESNFEKSNYAQNN